MLSICLSTIVWVIQAVNFLDFVSEDGHGFKVYFLYTMLSFPKIFTKLFLISIFISLFFILIRYDDSNELSIYWTIGISIKKFINKVICFSLLFVIINLSLTLYLSPKSQDLARSFIRSSSIEFFPSLIKEKKFIDTVSNLTIYVNQQSSDKRQLKNIVIKDQTDNQKFQLIIANEGKIVQKTNQNFLMLENGEIFSNINDKDFSNFKFENFEFNLSKFSTKSTITPKIQENSTLNILKCYFNLTYFKKYYLDSKELVCDPQSKKDITQEILKRFILPFYIPLICLISCMILLINKTKKFYTPKKILTFAIGFLVIFLSEIGLKYSGTSNLSNLIFISFPFLTYFLFYFIFLKNENLH